MEACCSNCAYRDCPRNEEPCESCLDAARRGVGMINWKLKEEETGHGCYNCRFKETPTHSYPCERCWAIPGHLKWEPKEEKMNTPKLEVFDVVELRDGRFAVVLPESEAPEEENLGLYSRDYVFTPRITNIRGLLEDDTYDDNLIHRSSSELDVMKVLKYSKVSANPQFSYDAYMRMITDIVIRRGSAWGDFKGFNMEERLKPCGWTWVREKVKEVTMAEVEEKFGCKVKIVKEEN